MCSLATHTGVSRSNGLAEHCVTHRMCSLAEHCVTYRHTHTYSRTHSHRGLEEQQTYAALRDLWAPKEVPIATEDLHKLFLHLDADNSGYLL
jgi:hypothetical protein